MKPPPAASSGPPMPSSRRMPWPHSVMSATRSRRISSKVRTFDIDGERQGDRQVVPQPGAEDPAARRPAPPASSSAAAARPRIVVGWTRPEIVIASLPARLARRHAAATSVGRAQARRRRRRRCRVAPGRRRRRSRPARRAGRRGRTPRRGRGPPSPGSRRSRRGTRATVGSARPRRSPGRHARSPRPRRRSCPCASSAVEGRVWRGAQAGYVPAGPGGRSRQIDRVRPGAATNMMAKATMTTSRASGMRVTMTMFFAPVVSAP